MKHRISERGTAVITALLMVSVASAIALSMITRQRIDIVRTQQLLDAEQAYYYTDGGLYWAEAFLAGELDEENQKWPVVLEPTKIADGQGQVQAVLTEMKPLINLNKLDDETVRNQLLTAIADLPNVDADVAQRIVSAAAAWVKNEPSASYDEQYMALNPAYRAAHQPMKSVTELRLVSGVTPALYQQIAPLVCAVPSSDGAYYLLRTTVTLHDQLLNVYTVLQRSSSEGKVGATVVWQSRGTL